MPESHHAQVPSIEALPYTYREQYAVDIRMARIFNVYEPEMPASHERAVRSFVDAAINCRDLVVTGDGTATRCFS